MSFLKRLFGKKESDPKSFLHLDFEKTFPHVFWTSGWGRDATLPQDFRYKVLSIRQEPSGDFEVVLIQELRDGQKTEMQRWSVPSHGFGASEDMIHMLEEQFGVTFDRVDMSAIRTFEDFEAKSIRSGWQVS